MFFEGFEAGMLLKTNKTRTKCRPQKQFSRPNCAGFAEFAAKWELNSSLDTHFWRKKLSYGANSALSAWGKELGIEIQVPKGRGGGPICVQTACGPFCSAGVLTRVSAYNNGKARVGTPALQRRRKAGATSKCTTTRVGLPRRS